MKKKRKLAVFDIDGTIFRSSLLIELVNELVRKEIFPKDVEVKIDSNYRAWVNRIGNYDEYIMQVVEAYIDNISGKSEKAIKETVRVVVKEQKGKVYRFTRDLIKSLKENNYYLLAVSGSPAHVVEEFTKQLGFDNYYGSIFEVKSGKFTGEFLSNMQQEKKKVLEKFIKDNQKLFTLKDSIGVGDTESDIPILELVENPIAFNPNIELVKHAKKMGWRIVVERKDVVYDLKNFKILSE